MAHKRGYANSENALTSEEYLIMEILIAAVQRAGPAFTNVLAIWVKQSPLVEKSVVLNDASETSIKVNWIFLWHALKCKLPRRST